MTTTLYTHKHSPAIANQHRANMAETLAHRIEVARAKNDFRLLEQLERERRQIESALPKGTSSGGLLSPLKAFWQHVATAIQNADKLHVESIVDSTGEVWWYGHDPRSGKTIWAESESEVIKWIEDNGLGRNF